MEQATPEWVQDSLPLWHDLAQIKDLEAQIKTLTSRKDDAIKKLQEQCKHPKELTLEGKYVDSHFGGVLFRPCRVCKLCGYGEEGWGAGYWKLSNSYGNVPEVSHDEAWKHVRTFISQDQMMELGRYGEKARLRVLAEGE